MSQDKLLDEDYYETKSFKLMPQLKTKRAPSYRYILCSDQLKKKMLMD